MAFRMREPHWEMLVTFFEANPSLVTGRFSGANGKEKQKQLWAEIAAQLNSLGLGQRSVDKWQKGGNIREDQKKTGGGPPLETPFSKFELRILEILGPLFIEGVNYLEIGLTKSTLVNRPKISFRNSIISQDGLLTQTILSASNSQAVQEKKSDTPTPNKTTTVLDPSPKLVDHSYTLSSAPKKLKADSGTIEKSYQETVVLLREIKETLKEVPAEIRDLKLELRELRNAITLSKSPSTTMETPIIKAIENTEQIVSLNIVPSTQNTNPVQTSSSTIVKDDITILQEIDFKPQKPPVPEIDGKNFILTRYIRLPLLKRKMPVPSVYVPSKSTVGGKTLEPVAKTSKKNPPKIPKGKMEEKKSESWYCKGCQEDRVADMRLCVICKCYLHDECLGLTKEDKIEGYICPYCS
ncbi:unnamed protein product [Ceutorhynchus assimilis]|uniref:Regulatory protein zeste n=1 Tax=Ceutorhynchus assimilis TaxID=467358 RepID=A0A9N9QNV1_9CUCU|nr:unnamed protein product [Ceutorhynchus assimilis]